MLAVFKILAEAVVLAKAMFVSLLPLAIVRWTEGRGLLLMGMGPGLVLPAVEPSGGLFWAVATSERLQTMAEGRAGEAVSPPVARASVETVTAPESTVWLTSAGRAEVSPKGFMLTVTKTPLGAVALAAAVSPSVVLLVGPGVSTVVSGVADSVVPVADKVSAEAVDSVRWDFASVESGKVDVSGMDRTFPPGGL